MALVLGGATSHLVARAFDYDDVGLYAMQRFENTQETPDAIKAPADFDIDAFIAKGALNFASSEIIRLKLQVSDSLRTTLTETPLSADMTISEDGKRFLAKAEVPDTWQLRWWIQSQEADVEVLAPESLRQTIVNSLQETLTH